MRPQQMLVCLFANFIFLHDVEAQEAPSTLHENALAQIIKVEGLDQVIQKYEKALGKNSADDHAREMLKRIVSGPYGITRDESLRLRKIIRQYTHHATAVLPPPDEPGEPLVISGVVRDLNGKPITGALIYVFHAEARGNYTHERPMDEANARLFDYMKTGADGRYEFRTIRPGGYPRAPIPQHVHMLVTASGYRDHKCRSTCQLVFADDPRMTAEWHKWAKEGGNPILAVSRDNDGVQRSIYDIVLYKN